MSLSAQAMTPTAITSIYGGWDAVKPNYLPHTPTVAQGDEYTARAVVMIRTILDEHHAVVPPEMEARIAEGKFASSPGNINPHHITTALQSLRRTGELIYDQAPARGGRVEITTIQPADQYRRATTIAKAAARKRLLYARYSGWAQGTARYPKGLVGPAGETAVRGAILRAGTLIPAASGAGEVSELLGVRLPGPVDSAGYLLPFTRGLPGQAVTLLIEVKNIRSWIYPSSAELYQVLYKAAFLQLHCLAQPIIPLLACRKAHITTFWMAKQLGFIVVEMNRQYVGDVIEDDLMEVRNELHFYDLTRGSEPSIRVEDRLRKTLPRIGEGVARVWRNTCTVPGLLDLFYQLRSTSYERAEFMEQLRRVAVEQLGLQGGW